jgi:hypothetical protein
MFVSGIFFFNLKMAEGDGRRSSKDLKRENSMDLQIGKASWQKEGDHDRRRGVEGN